MPSSTFVSLSKFRTNHPPRSATVAGAAIVSRRTTTTTTTATRFLNKNIPNRVRQRTDSTLLNSTWKRASKSSSTASSLTSSASSRVIKEVVPNYNFTAFVVIGNIAIGCCAASFWRGAWYILDDNLYPDDPFKSAISSFVLGTLGIAYTTTIPTTANISTSSGTIASSSSSSLVANTLRGITLGRLAHIYAIAWSCVLVWRGTWLAWDCFDLWINENEMCTNTQNHTTDNDDILPESSKATIIIDDNDDMDDTSNVKLFTTSREGESEQTLETAVQLSRTQSGMISHLLSLVVLTSCGLLVSVFAPPASPSIQLDRFFQSGVSSMKKIYTFGNSNDFAATTPTDSTTSLKKPSSPFGYSFRIDQKTLVTTILQSTTSICRRSLFCLVLGMMTLRPMT
jgi:Fuseless